MRRLAEASELLDGALDDELTLAGNLRDLRRINRIFGGAAMSVRAIRTLVETSGELPREEVLRVIDVGTGAADIPRHLTRAPGPWAGVRVTAVDNRPEVLAAAVALDPWLGTDPVISLELADGRRLPYPDRSFDVAHASLVLHHLDRDGAVAFLRELARVARIGVVVNDLDRSRHAWLGAWLVLHAITGNPWTRHDGPLSVRRAWRLPEARSLLADAGLRPIRELHGVAGHRWAVAAVRG